MEIIPIGERVLIKPIKKEEVTKSGIYIPESAQEQKKEGSVVAVGKRDDGADLPPSKPGDRVLYGATVLTIRDRRRDLHLRPVQGRLSKD